MIARFLRGEMGPNDRVDPYLVALIFAGDRAEASSMLRKWMEEGYLVIVDRYVYSNIAFQCAKLSTAEERKQLRDWILDFEFHHNKLPKPDLNLLLHVPIEFTRQQLEDSSKKSETELMKEFFSWIEKFENKTLAGQNPTFDRNFLNAAAKRAGLGMIIWRRTIDLHAICYAHMLGRRLEIPLSNERSDLTADMIFNYVGLSKEPRPPLVADRRHHPYAWNRGRRRRSRHGNALPAPPSRRH